MVEQGVDVGAQGGDRRRAGIGGEGRQHLGGLLGVGGEHLLQRREIGGGHEVGRQADGAAIGGLEARAGERQPQAGSAGQAWQEPAGADVREEADAGLRHGEGGALGDDPIAGGPGDADAAAHGDAVHDGDHRLGVGEDQVVELVFDEEEPPRDDAVAGGARGQGADIAAGGKAAIAGVVDEDGVQGGIGPPGQERGDHRLAHAGGERAQGGGAVEGQAAERAVAAGEDFGFSAHDLNISRAMITRMISLVPSRIWWTRRSRTIRSTG